MAKDREVDANIAASKAMADVTEQKTADVEDYVKRALELVERSKKLLDRPRDTIQLSKPLGDIATGQVKDRTGGVPAGAKGGRAGGKFRAAKPTPEHAAASARWKKR